MSFKSLATTDEPDKRALLNEEAYQCMKVSWSKVFTKRTQGLLLKATEWKNKSTWIAEKLPSEEFELTANSLRAHIETHGGLILRTLSYLTVDSQDESHCVLAVNFPWVCNSHHVLTVSYLWDQPMSPTCSGSNELTAILLLTSRWDIQVSLGWVWP